MKYFSKKILTACLLLALAFSMAVPTFAATPPYNQRVWIYNVQPLQAIIQTLQCGRSLHLILNAGICSQLMPQKIYSIFGIMPIQRMDSIFIEPKVLTVIFIPFLLMITMTVPLNVLMRAMTVSELFYPHISSA